MARKQQFDGGMGKTPPAKGPKAFGGSPKKGAMPMQPKAPTVQAYAEGGMVVRGAGAAIKGKKYRSC